VKRRRAQRRRALRDHLVFVALYVPVSFVLGWSVAAAVLLAAFIGYTVGTARGEVRAGREGMAVGVEICELAQVTAMEQMAVGRLAPDDPRRVAMARRRGELLDSLGLEPGDIEITKQPERPAA
jgi:hypothetical protein